jgi:hypothetical protein
MNTQSAATAAAPTTSAVRETTSAPWSTDDETFFRVVRELFTPSYLQGASALLASYDPEPGAA